MIYFVQAEIVGRIKIGFTGRKTSDVRLSCLQVASPVPLKLLAMREGSRETERRLHERFAEYRVQGEWFEAGPKLVRYIARLQGDTAIKASGRRKLGRGIRAARWLMERFREKREWRSDEIHVAASAYDLSRDALFSPEVKALPIRRVVTVSEDGNRHWVWRAQEGWPEEVA